MPLQLCKLFSTKVHADLAALLFWHGVVIIEDRGPFGCNTS
jgi:hypothetical protein